MPVPTPLLLAHGWGSLTRGLGHSAQPSAPMQVMGGVRGVAKGWGQLWDPRVGCIPPVHWVCPGVGLQSHSETLICHISVSAPRPQPGYGVVLRALSCGVWGLSRCVLSAAGRNRGQTPNPR